MSCSGNCEACGEKGSCTDETKQAEPKPSEMGRIRRKIVVMSGKGGVGKSTMAVQIARALAAAGERVGLLDVDLHGPSIPILMGAEGARMGGTENLMEPIACGPIKVASVGFLLREPDAAIVWRGPLKIGVIQQLLENVDWGELDTLVVDCPPGTGDEPLSVCQMIGSGAGAVIVTTPQEVAAADVARSIRFAEDVELPVWGLVENMSGFVCPHCGEVTEVFGSGAGERLAARFGVPFAGKVPLDPAVCASGDKGRSLRESEASPAVAEALQAVVANILAAAG